MRLLATVAVATSITGLAFAQTQSTRPSAYATMPTLPSAFPTSAISPCYSSINPTSPCYSGNLYLSYSAIPPIEFSDMAHRKVALLFGADSLNEQEATSRIEAKGYSNISGLKKDNHGIWRGKATVKDGRPVAIILDLQGNIYSESRP
ncbi:hypothetical protein [Bradyrhizobium sp.]|uniref:hypothetical protein n=1 Tax=Bradyrhizobium sp. TaxID=376 RepID=UPI003C329928